MGMQQEIGVVEDSKKWAERRSGSRNGLKQKGAGVLRMLSVGEGVCG